MMEAASTSETSVNFYGATSEKTVIFKMLIVGEYIKCMALM
jgi:hypothetical protein